MFLRSEFLKIVESIIDRYPDLALAYRAGDPRAFMAVLANVEMASMLSQQMDLASAEVFGKSRDTTVLADAALKGILPKGEPCIVNVSVKNDNTFDYVISSGRVLVDSSGREYTVMESLKVGPGMTGILQAKQSTTKTIEHVFEVSEPFARIEVPAPDSDMHVSGLHVRDTQGNQFSYSYRYTNIEPGEKIYHVETDEYRRLFIIFGYDGISGNGSVGYQPVAQEKFYVDITETHGDISISQGSPFTFDYAANRDESLLTMKMDSMEAAGANPPDIATLRNLINYPSIYDDNAVFHGEFDRLIRRHLTGFNFLSIWNEQREEEVRGASVDNINTIFVSVNAEANGVEKRIEEIIHTADDSYKIKHVAPVDSPYGISIRAEVARVYSLGAVEGQLRTLMLGVYGKNSLVSRKGLSVPTVQQVTGLVKKYIQGLHDENSDFSLTINVPDPVLPEHWHFLSEESLEVTVTESNQSGNMYGR